MSRKIVKNKLKLNTWKIDTTITHNGQTFHLQKTGYKTKTAAEAEYDQVVNNFLMSKGIKRQKDTMDDLISAFILYKGTRVKLATLTLTKGILNRYIDQKDKYKKISSFYTNDKLADYRMKISSLDYTQDFLNKIVRSLRELSDFAFKRGFINAEMYRLSTVHLESINGKPQIAKIYHIWTKEQYQRFIATFNDDDKYKVLFQWMFFSGCRIGETCALQWKDFDKTNRRIFICKTANARYGTGKSEISTPKTLAGTRYIFLNDDMINSFVALKLAYGHNEDSFLFFGYSQPIGHTTIRRVFDTHTKMANLPRIKIHEIRHTNNTWLLDDNPTREAANIITKRLGRSSLKVTLDIYYHSRPELEENITKKIKI